ncbi:MAG: hypothetical protein WAV41_05445 [Microgenomates group bacterium]
MNEIINMASVGEIVGPVFETISIFCAARRRDGCIEVAAVTLGGNSDKVYAVSRRKIAGQLDPKRWDHEIIEESDLVVARGFNITCGGEGILTEVENTLKENNITGAMVISSRGRDGHAVAIIRDVESGTLLKVDAGADKLFETTTLTDALRQKGDDVPYAVLLTRRKK